MQKSCSTEHLSMATSQTLTQNLTEALSEALPEVTLKENTKIQLLNKEA